MTELPDLERVAAIIEQVASEEILPRFGHLAAADIAEKTPGDPVTAADHAAETRLTAALKDLLPGSVVVGEEAVAARPDTLDLLDQEAPVWVIDPLDGTANFVAGRAHFATIVALVVAGTTEAGWIHRPIDGHTAIARRGGGARLDGQPLRLTGGKPLATCMAIATAPDMPSYQRYGLQRLEGAFSELGACTASGIDYVELARNRLDVAVYTWQHPWDHAAGVLIHAEAGGRGGRLDGTPYRATDRTDAPLLLAPDDAIFTAVAKLLRGPGGKLRVGS